MVHKRLLKSFSGRASEQVSEGEILLLQIQVCEFSKRLEDFTFFK
jgi:hypothetical protein